MNEYNNMRCEEVKVAPIGNMPLNELLNITCVKAQDALKITRTISAMLFGGETLDKKDTNPMCFENALQYHDETLSILCEELLRMASRLGC